MGRSNRKDDDKEEEKTSVIRISQNDNLIKKNKILSNTTRSRINRFITSNPGINFNGIRKGLDLSTGSTVHHLDVLLRERLIKKKKEGYSLKFFPYDYKINRIIFLTRKQNIILNIIKQRPGITQKEIIQITDFSQSTVSWILAGLKKNNLVISEYTPDETGKMGIRYRVFNPGNANMFNNCPFCGKIFRFHRSHNYCPFCNKRLVIHDKHTIEVECVDGKKKDGG